MHDFFSNLNDDEKILAKSLRSYILLLDAGKAIDLLENVSEDEQLFRLYWILCVTLLSSARDVLRKDIIKYPKMGEIWLKRHETLNKLFKLYEGKDITQCPDDYVYWCRLFNKERNNLIHEYKGGYNEEETVLGVYDTYDNVFNEERFSIDKDIYRPMSNFDEYGDIDCRDFVANALEWWEKELVSLIRTYKNNNNQ